MHIIKNERPLKQVVLIKIISIILALIVSAIFIICVTGLNPIDVMSATFKGTFGSSRRFFSVLRDACFLFLIAIGLTPAFKMNFMNNGGEGQVLIGALASSAIMITFADKLPNFVLIIVMLLSSIVAGVIWGFIPAILKVKFNTNETLLTLMMNYVAIQIVEFCVDLWDKKQSHVVGIINQNTNKGWLPSLLSNQYLLIYMIVLAIAIFMYFYLKNSKQGYEIAVVGESHRTAKYAGINVNKTTIRTVILSSAICAIAGFLNVSGISHTISSSTAGGKGFTAIIVAWLGKFNVIIMGLISFMLQFLTKGATQIASDFNLNDYIADVIIAIILFFIIGADFFANYKIVSKKEGK